MHLDNEQVDELISYLQGTIKTVESAVDELFDIDEEISISNYEDIDNSLFNCEICGWWYDIGVMSPVGDCVCDSCAEEMVENLYG